MSKGSNKRADTLTLKPSEFKSALRDIVLSGRAPFVWGPPGIGKSQIAKQVAVELGFDTFADVRLSQMEPTDIRGIPMPTKDSKGRNVVEWSRPDFFDPDTLTGEKFSKGQDENGEPYRKAFYLFDEMNSAPQSIQAASYQIVLDKKLGPHVMGPRDFVMAAGNRDTDKGSTFKMPTPLLNRFIHLELAPDFDDWQEHALGAMFDPNVVGYLTFAKQDMFQFDPSSASRGYPTPRSWEMVSDMLRAGPTSGEGILTAMVAGAVGDGVAVKFMEYRRKAKDLPNPSDILSGKVTKLDRAEVSLMYTLTTSLCYELKTAYDKSVASKDREVTKTWHKASDNFLGFMLDNFTPELVIMGARTAMAIHKLDLNPEEMSNWERFAADYQELILKT